MEKMITEIKNNKRVVKEEVEEDFDIWASLRTFLKECNFEIIEDQGGVIIKSVLGHLQIEGENRPTLAGNSLHIILKNKDKKIVNAIKTSRLWSVLLNEEGHGLLSCIELTELLLSQIREEWSKK